MAPDPVSRVLSRYPRPSQPVTPITSLGSRWAAARDIWLTGHRWAARRSAPGRSGPTVERVSAIHGWLAEVGDQGSLPIPVPVADLGGGTVQHLEGRCWEIAPWLPGRPDLEAKAKCGASCGRVHLAGQFPRPAGQACPAGAQSRRRAAVAASRPGEPGIRSIALGGWPDLDQAASEQRDATQWLALAGASSRPVTGPRRCIAARRDSPAVPPGRSARTFPLRGRPRVRPFGFRRDGIRDRGGRPGALGGDWLAGDRSLVATALAAYEHVRPLGPSEAALIGTFEDAADVLISGHWLAWHLLEHRKFADPAAVWRGVARGFDRLGRLAERLNSPRTIP